MPMNQMDLNRKTKGIIAIVIVVISCLLSGAIFAHKYGYFMPVSDTVATVPTQSEDPEEIVEEEVIEEVPVEEVPEAVEESPETVETETPTEQQSGMGEDGKTFGENVGNVVDKGVGVLKGGAGWLGEKLSQWGND